MLGVLDGDGVAVPEGVGVALGVTDGDVDTLGLGVALGVLVGVGVAVSVGVGVALGVAEGPAVSDGNTAICTASILKALPTVPDI